MKTLILGGVRSGKSRLAEKLAIESGLRVTFIATATAGDREMSQRIQAHQDRRPADWHTVEEPVLLGRAVAQWRDSEAGCLVIDCITLWLTNLLGVEDAAVLQRERRSLLDALVLSTGDVIIVSNETNMGVIPMGELSRRYCDIAGTLHQELAHICDRVILTVAGLPHALKGRI